MHWLLPLIFVFACTPQAPKGIQGTIVLADEFRARIQPNAVLYVIARDADRPQSPPVAVRRYPQPFEFPLAFTLNHHDAMVPNVPLPRNLSVTARISQKGSATPIQPGDLTQAKGPQIATLGAQDLHIVINSATH